MKMIYSFFLILLTLLPSQAEFFSDLKPGARLLFIGDSITDMGREKRKKTNDMNHILGHSYVFMLAGKIGMEFPEKDLTFINRGISGNTVADLSARWQQDALEVKPDVLTVLIGANDIGRGLRDPAQRVSAESYMRDYREILRQSREINPELKIILLDPFVLPAGRYKDEARHAEYRARVDELGKVVAEMVREYGALHIKTQQVYDNALEKAPAEKWIWDGVHPLAPGHALMAEAWMAKVFGE